MSVFCIYAHIDILYTVYPILLGLIGCVYHPSIRKEGNRNLVSLIVSKVKLIGRDLIRGLTG